MPSNWSKIRDEWLDRTTIEKDDAQWQSVFSELIINERMRKQRI